MDPFVWYYDYTMTKRRQFITTLSGAIFGASTFPLLGKGSEINQIEYDKLYSKWHQIIEYTTPVCTDVSLICKPISKDIAKYRCAQEMDEFEQQLRFDLPLSVPKKHIGQLVIPTIRRKYSHSNHLDYLNYCTFAYEYEKHILTIKFRGKEIKVLDFIAESDIMSFKSYSATISIDNHPTELKWTEWVHPTENLWTELEKVLRNRRIL